MSDAGKIIAGLEDAIAYAAGDECRGKASTVITPKHVSAGLLSLWRTWSKGASFS